MNFAANIAPTNSEAAPAKREARHFELHDGDCGIVIRADGSTELFSKGIDSQALMRPEALTDDKCRQMLVNGQTLMVLRIVANLPELHQVILSYAGNEGVVGIAAANSNG